MSWIDAATGPPCIMRRGTDGALSGYVGIGPDHPLAGVGEKALPHDPPIVVHGVLFGTSGAGKAFAVRAGKRKDGKEVFDSVEGGALLLEGGP